MANLSTRDRSRRLASPGDILPVELWELIFRHIEFDSKLLRLARVCSTFNAVSIRLLLALHGQGQDVFDRTDLRLSVYTLRGLYLSLRSFSATRVTCSLDRAETRWNIHLLDALFPLPLQLVVETHASQTDTWGANVGEKLLVNVISSPRTLSATNVDRCEDNTELTKAHKAIRQLTSKM
jgi:hypothetical protein